MSNLLTNFNSMFYYYNINFNYDYFFFKPLPSMKFSLMKMNNFMHWMW